MALDQPWIGYLLVAMVYLALTLWAISHVVTSRAAPAIKGLWIALLLLFPALGLFNWLIMGPRRAQSMDKP